MNGSRSNNLSKSGQIAAIAIFLVVNMLFIVRYGYRIGNCNAIIPLGIAACYAVFVAIITKAKKISVSNGLMLLVMAIYSGIVLYIVHQIPLDLDLCTVDRWRIITLFWDSVEQGIYPYAAKTEYGNMPGASPVYFVLTYPFYKTNAFALIALSTLWIWWFLFPQVSDDNRKRVALLLMSAPAFVFEILSRSTLIFNSIIVAIYCVYLLRFAGWNTRTVIANAIIGGLLLNTRTVFVIPFIIIVFMLARRARRLKHLILWCVVVSLTYIAAFLPFVAIWGLDTVLLDNPFRVQHANLYPVWFMAVMILLSIAIGCTTNKRNCVFQCGLMIFVSGVAYISQLIGADGFYDAILGRGADISYLCLCLPFILPYLNLDPYERE